MPVEELRSLVNHLLVLRQGSPLESCDFTIGDFSGGDDVRHVNLWFRQAVICRARKLRICMLGDCSMDPWLELDNLPLVSEHLTKLQLDGVRVHNSLLNFSRCPALEYLEIECCNLSLVTKISSDSIKYLRINDSVLNSDSRIHIYAPNLDSPHLVYLRERTPMLYSMPSLVEVFVRIEECTDRCNGANYETCDCEACDNSDNMDDGSGNSVLLKGVSEAKNLALISRPEMMPQPKVEMKLCVSSTKRSAAISKYLKKVELKCEVVDDSVLKVLKFLSTYNIFWYGHKRLKWDVLATFSVVD
ncbi:unnamed protein product [Miscanthus lutarioriparius]|uniref:F-box/LRR-repeat protein 15/At3g58940/PEG3-like LRR domain-containing protein n=1 Tax=Miscanthus lutarioriparius TaxID=422564 RepID=A0A811QLD9_9POAL|nr:unnamed protein product [Miscanthus lutarioriparius]